VNARPPPRDGGRRRNDIGVSRRNAKRAATATCGDVYSELHLPLGGAIDIGSDDSRVAWHTKDEHAHEQTTRVRRWIANRVHNADETKESVVGRAAPMSRGADAT
jgi:hypothetical protein